VEGVRARLILGVGFKETEASLETNPWFFYKAQPGYFDPVTQREAMGFRVCQDKSRVMT
jgi:hypothetical protein